MLLNNKHKVIQLVESLSIIDEENKNIYAEVFTPFNIVNQMLDMLPCSIWNDPNLKWFEPSVGIGNFMILIYYRLMDGLKNEFPSSRRRHQHIIKKMLYMSEINIKNIKICKFIFGHSINIHHGDTLRLDVKKEWGINSFDVIIGNPPYHKSKTERGSTPLVFNEFVDMLIDKCRFFLFIIPSRWFASGKGLKEFRYNMLKRNDIRQIIHYEKYNMLFCNKILVAGGIQILLKDSMYRGYCNLNGIFCELGKYDIIVNPMYHTILDKILMAMRKGLHKLCIGQTYTNIATNDHRLIKLEDIAIKDINNYYKCYVSSNNGFVRYIKKTYITQQRDYSKWKVFTVEANGYWKYFGRTFIGLPDEICNQSFIVFEVDTQEQALSLVSYMDTKLVNFLLGLRKISQHIKPDTCKWIPLLPLNKMYNDEDLYMLFGLTLEEQYLIEEQYETRKLVKKKIQFLIENLNNITNELNYLGKWR